MKIAEFISLYRQNRPDGHFFDREALKFFGEKISEMSYNGVTVIIDRRGHRRDAHELRTIQHDEMLGKRWKLNYFDAVTFDQIFPDDSIIDSWELTAMQK